MPTARSHRLFWWLALILGIIALVGIALTT